jgi:hypothetical protein
LRTRSALLCLCFAAVLGAPALSGQPRKIGELELTLGGLTATVTPANPVIPKNLQGGVQIVVQSGGTALTAAQLATFLGGSFQVQGVYSGPGLPQAVDVPQAGGAVSSDPLVLVLPAVTESGDYTLSNLRFVVGGSSVLDVTPGTVPVKVIDQVLVTSVQTRALTLEEIQAKGIVLDSSDVLGFDFTIGLQLSSQVVNITFPVVFDRQGVPIPQPLAPPPAPPRLDVPIPELPTIVPLLLQRDDGGGELPQVRLPGGGMGTIRIPSILVIPGNVGFLKQFFSAQLYVANGAPGGSNLVVHDVTGTVVLPPGADQVAGTADDPLSLPNTTHGPQPATLPVLGLGPDGKPSVDSLNPGETGQAEFLIRGEKEGFHTVDFNIHATLDGLVTGPVGISGTASGGVLVRNPYFDMAFTVPGIVRKGETFKVFATVTNISQALANQLTVSLDQAATSGATITGDPTQSTPTLKPGDAKTFIFQFTSQRTGKVVASYLHFDTSDGTTGQLHFSLGVDSRGVPLSPDTLSLPAAVDNLPEDVVLAAMRVLGQGWSVANAPAGTLPPGVIRTNKTVVTQKALALAEAGLRQGLGQPAGDALRDLVTDFWGGSPLGSSLDPGFDQLLRQSDAGQNLATVVGANLGGPQQQAGGAISYERAVSAVEASGPDFLALAVGSGAGAAPVDVSLADGNGNILASTTPGGAIPGGVLLPLGAGGAGGSSGGPYLGLVTAPATPPYTLTLTGKSAGTVDLSVTLPRGDGTFLRGAVSGVTVTPGSRLQLAIDGDLNLAVDSNGDGTVDLTVPLSQESIQPSGPRLISANVIGPETLSQAGPFGFNVALLFDRPVDAGTASDVHHYTVPGNAVQAAGPQLSGRLVFANLAQPEGPYVPATLAVSGIADQRGATGPAANVNLTSRLQDPGAIVSGRIFNADGSPVSSAVVTYVNFPYDPNCSDPERIATGMARIPVTADGRYQFRYVRQDNCGAPFSIATTDPATGALRQVSSYVRTAGQQLVLDIALFGRGSVGGTVRDLAGQPVPGAQVIAVSGTDPQIGGQTTTDGDGHYLINGITVGPVNVSAGKGVSLGHSAGRIDRAGTTATVDVTLDGGSVKVHGTVQKIENGVAGTVPGAVVIYYWKDGSGNRTAVGATTTGADGSYSLASLPTGPYDLVAALNSRDQTSVSGVAAAGDNLTVNVAITVATNFGTVNGRVVLPDGSPAGGALVSLDQTGVLTAPDGTFSLPGVPVRPSVAQTVRAQSLDGLRSGQATVIVGLPNQVVDGVSIALSGLGTAQFTVLDPAGLPVAGQEVRLFGGFCIDACGCLAASTDANGQARFPGLGLGTLTGRAIKVSGSFVDLALGNATIASDGTTGFGLLQFAGSGTVTGLVVDPNGQPVLGADVSLFSNTFDAGNCILGTSLSQRVQTDTAGRFTFRNVNVGRVSVSASQAFFPGAVGAQGVLQKNGDTVAFSLKLVNSIAGVLSGTVSLPDGVTAAGSGVQVTANGPLPDVTVETDAQGFYRFAKIFPEGLYTLTASDPVTGGVFRTQVYLRAGQDATENLRLKGTGTVTVHVVDGAGQPVASAFVKLQETDYPNESFDGPIEDPVQGTVAFDGVFEGGLSVQATDTFGRGGRASAVLPAGTEALDVTVQLTTTGSVAGHFFAAGGVTPIPFGVVQLIAGGRIIGQATTAGSGDVGSYAFDFVPAGPVRLEAQDPLTAHTGIAVGLIDHQGQLLALDVVAQGIGTVEGMVTSDGLAQPGAHVEVVSGSFAASTFADSTGSYRMAGVPEGRIVVTADLGNGFLSGTNAANLTGDGTVLTLDVALRGSGSVSGIVVRADGVTPAPISALTLEVGGTGGGTLSTTSDAAGSFSFARVPAGSGRLSASVLGDIDVGATTVNVPVGGTANVTLRLNGTGALSGLALDSAGQPVAGTIQLAGTGPFPYYLTLTAGVDGKFALPEVLAGPFTARLRVTSGGFTLFGSTSGTIVADQVNELTVQVQPSGTITGLVLRPDGHTPAVGANVSIQLASGGLVTLQAQNDGRFTATGVPLSAFTVRVNDPQTGGLGLVQGQTLATNGQTVDVGTITLDANALAVLTVDPPDGATHVDVHQVVTLTFSEPLQGTGGIFVTNGGSTVPANVQLAGDGKTVTLTGTWPDSSTLTVNATSSVVDLFGRPLVQPLASRFTTVDLSPPAVVSIVPAKGALQVDPATAVVVTFSEPLSITAPLASVVSISTTAGPVAGSAALSAPNVLTFTPSAPLAGNALYTVTVNGATDLVGNIQTVAFTSTFLTPDTVPPTLQLTAPANGAVLSQAKPAISITLADTLSGVDPATAVLTLDAQAVAATLAGNVLAYTPPAALAEGSHALAASVKDRAGNPGSLSASFVVDTVPPSVAILTGIAEGQTLTGQVAISATATDTGSGVARIDLRVDGAVQSGLPAPGFSAVLDTTHLAEGPHQFTVQAVDAAGNAGPASSPVQAFVENVNLSVSIPSPAPNTPFEGQVTVTAVPSEPVTKITFTLGSQTVTATAAPYQGTLSLAGVPDGPQTVTATATNFVGNTATATVTIVVQQTPPPAPNATLIYAEPPNNGLSLVHGLPGAVRGGVTVTVTHMVSGAKATPVAAADGSFATSIAAAVDDTLSLTATDVVGNVSTATLVTVRRTPSLPPPSGSTSLHYEGTLADRVGLTAGSLTPDGQNDAVFTLSLTIGSGITRTISYIDLMGSGSAIRSTRSGQPPLGVAADAGAPLQNNSGGQISFAITSGATLTLFAGDGGFIQPGVTYTATAVFVDGARFVGTFTIVPPADRTLVAHSATIAASPATVVVNGATPGTTTLTITDIRDIDGTLVPDGAKVALSAVNMAAHDPAGGTISSAGGTIVDGDPAPNNASFKVFTIFGGRVTATYSSSPVTPTPILGALAVVQMQAADADGNILGTEAVATLDLNLRAGTDQAIVGPVPPVLYADGADRLSHFTIQVRDAAGNPAPDGTAVIVSAASCAARNPQGFCISSAGGEIRGGQGAAAGSIYRLFTTAGGVVQGDYSPNGVKAGDLQVRSATIQVLPANASGAALSSTALGTATVSLVGAGSVEMAAIPSTVPYVFPVVPVQVFVHHAHDIRAGLIPDGSNLVLSAVNCATRATSGFCVNSSGGTVLDGAPSTSGSIYRVFPLASGQATATYSAQGANAPGTGQTNIANFQVLMGDVQGAILDSTGIGVLPIQILGPSNAIGSAEPPIILGDGASHTSTVTFTPLLDAVGNLIPDGSKVVVSAANCGGRDASGFCINSAGGQILDGTASPSGSIYKFFTVQGGKVTATYADQGLAVGPGQTNTARVVLLPSDASGAILSSTALGSIPVSLAGLTSGTGTVSPGVVFADGSDQRTTVTFTNFKDTAGQPVPDGTMIAASAANCFTRNASGFCISSAGGQVLGTNQAPFFSGAQLFTITNGQVVLVYSSQGVTVGSGQQTATVGIQAVTPQGNSIGATALATVPIQLLSPGSSMVAVTPANVFADGADRRSQIVVSGLLDSDGITPVPNGTKVGLTVANCATRNVPGFCISSVGGAILSAGTTPGDGTPSPSNSLVDLFTLTGGQINAVYSALGLFAGVNEQKEVSVSALPASNSGNLLSGTSIGVGTIQLRGMSSATAAGPATLSLSGQTTGTVTFSGIKDSAGNTVPDGANVAVTLGNCASRDVNGFCNLSTGGTLTGGAASPSGSQFKVFTVTNGSVTVPYSTAGAATGTARVQALPARSDGTVIGGTTLVGGVWAINVTN